MKNMNKSTSLYDREDRIGDYDANGNILISYTHGPGIDEPVAITTDNSTYFYIPDIQGSIRAIIGTDGNAVATYQYDAWGNIISYNGTLAQHNDYLYTGREYDWQSGIYYYRARYYNPELGRFLSQDPAGMVDGPNMYVYVKNEPVNGVDPEGKGWCSAFHFAVYFNVAWMAWLDWSQHFSHRGPRGARDKWGHAFVGCKLRQTGAPRACAEAIANDKEILDLIENTLGGNAHVSEWDIKATIKGWDWGNEGYWGRCCFLWWCWSCWKNYPCDYILDRHWSYLKWLGQMDK